APSRPPPRHSTKNCSPHLCHWQTLPITPGQSTNGSSPNQSCGPTAQVSTTRPLPLSKMRGANAALSTDGEPPTQNESRNFSMTRRARIPRNGKTIREVAEGTGLSTATIDRWTSAPREDYLAQANEKRAQVQELRAKGLSMRAIAAEIGCSVGLVHRYVKEAQEKK